MAGCILCPSTVRTFTTKNDGYATCAGARTFYYYHLAGEVRTGTNYSYPIVLTVSSRYFLTTYQYVQYLLHARTQAKQGKASYVQ